MICLTNTVPLDNYIIKINIDVLKYTSSIILISISKINYQYIAIKMANIRLYKMIIFIIRFGDNKGESHNYPIN